MNQVSGCLDGVQWYRTSKQAARNAYNAGEEVLICAVNLNPFTPDYFGDVVNSHSGLSFAEREGRYDWRRDKSNESRRYLAFYLKEK